MDEVMGCLCGAGYAGLAGMMTLPRELEVKDGQIWQQPVREIAQYHKNPCHYEHERLMVRQHFPAFADGRWI